MTEKANEISAAQTLFKRAPIEGMLVSADVLYTQSETARVIVQERGADYLFTVKGNQPSVAGSVKKVYEGLQHAFPPRSESDTLQHVKHNRGCLDARCFHRFDLSTAQAGFPDVAQAARLPRFVDRKTIKAEEVETEWLLTSHSLANSRCAIRMRSYWRIEK